MVNDGMLWGAVLLLLVANLFLAAWLQADFRPGRPGRGPARRRRPSSTRCSKGVMESRRDLEQSIAQSDARVTQGMANLSAFVSREQHRSGEAVQALTVEAGTGEEGA